jgi:5-methylthioadenosine/S-adenosylhomocysteine deaminase
VDAPPIPNAALLMGSDGRIAALGPDDSVPSPADAERRDYAGAALLPGLVNSHTHLELTGFEGRASEPDFREWILTIRRIKESRAPEEFLDAARQGVRDCWRGGVTTVADTGDSGAVLLALAELGGSGIVYQEVFGPDPAQCEVSFEGLVRQVERLASRTGPRVRLGVSPHAPYTVSGPLYDRVASYAGREGWPIAVHIAESPEESEFVSHGRGPFAEGWRRRGIAPLSNPAHRPSGPLPEDPTPLAWIAAHGVLGPRTLCIHAIQLSPGDLELLRRSGAAVAHCPLSNRRHHGRTAPLAELRGLGIPVGLGTDSVASVESLDLFAEAREARHAAGLSARDTLGLLTFEGARALGLEREIGSLTPGKWGDVAVIAVPPGALPDPVAVLEGVLQAGRARVVSTLVSGREVHRAPAPA